MDPRRPELSFVLPAHNELSREPVRAVQVMGERVVSKA